MKKDGGFAIFELITLILLLCVFLAGLVLLTGNVADSKNDTGSEPLSKEGEKLLDDLGAIFDQAEFCIPYSESVKVFADCDGDEKTGYQSLSDIPVGRSVPQDCMGLEIVDVHQEDKTGRLVADVYKGEKDKPEDEEPQLVILTEYLDNNAENPFSTDWEEDEISGKVDVNKVTLSIALQKDGESKVFKRTYTIGKPVH